MSPGDPWPFVVQRSSSEWTSLSLLSSGILAYVFHVSLFVMSSSVFTCTTCFFFFFCLHIIVTSHILNLQPDGKLSTAVVYFLFVWHQLLYWYLYALRQHYTNHLLLSVFLVWHQAEIQTLKYGGKNTSSYIFVTKSFNSSCIVTSFESSSSQTIQFGYKTKHKAMPFRLLLVFYCLKNKKKRVICQL